MSKLLVVFASALLISFSAANECVFTAAGQTGYSLNVLGPGSKITGIESAGNYPFVLTPCKNGQTCNSVSCMVEQQKSDGTGACQAYIALWDPNIQPTFGTENGGTWLFKYQNGQSSGGCSTGRTLLLTYKCQAGTKLGTVVISEPQACEYSMTVPTECACQNPPSSCSGGGGGGGGSGGGGSTTMSGGWVFIIILICAIFLYFVVMYVLKASKNQNGWGDVKGNCEACGQVVLLFRYAAAGCVATKEKLFNRGGGGGGTEVLKGDDQATGDKTDL